MKDDILLGATPKARRRRNRVKGIKTRGRLWKHSTLTDIDGLVPGSVLDGLFAVTLVRNPWDRMVSYYHWLRQQGFDHPSVRLAKSVEFADFAMHRQTRAAFRSSPAASYMRRADGREQCDAYIRIEQFSADAAPLVAHLGFPVELTVENPSDRDRDYRSYYTQSAADAVAESCAQDISRFGYRFD